MKVKLDSGKCDAHGDCVVAAPEIFDLGDDDDVVTLLTPEPAEELHDKARQAAEVCPTQAITIEE